MRVLIVQPWFTALGHPAQSVLNTARVLGARPDIGYLIAEPGVGQFSGMADELERYGPVERFNSHGNALRTATLLSLPAVLRVARRETELRRVFFLDAHLVALAGAWPLFARGSLRMRRVSSVYLGGPERIVSHFLARTLVSRFLSVAGRHLYLRTDELRQSWFDAFPEVSHNRICTIPTLELVDGEVHSPRRESDELRFGVIGQVRPGKSLEWLVPLFLQHRELGTLRVAGTFANEEHKRRLPFLSGYPNFDNRFLTESDMLAVASDQDYLLALYDDWDTRMEAATVHLAARVGRPVIVYDEGWPGRMVREFGCGVAVSRNARPDELFFDGLPRPGEDGYQALLAGIERFRAAHDRAGVREAILGELFGE